MDAHGFPLSGTLYYLAYYMQPLCCTLVVRSLTIGFHVLPCGGVLASIFHVFFGFFLLRWRHHQSKIDTLPTINLAGDLGSLGSYY